MIPCKECLKFTICRNKEEFYCKDLAKHVFKHFSVNMPLVEDFFGRPFFEVSKINYHFIFYDPFDRHIAGFHREI